MTTERDLMDTIGKVLFNDNYDPDIVQAIIEEKGQAIADFGATMLMAQIKPIADRNILKHIIRESMEKIPNANGDIERMTYIAMIKQAAKWLEE